MKDLKAEFLEAYKNLEDVLASAGYTRLSSGKGLVASYEDTLDVESDVKKGLQQCRIIRNGYQHENRTLFLPTPDAVALLNKVSTSLDVRTTAKDMIRRTKKLSDTNKVSEVLSQENIELVAKGYALPIVSSDNIYLGCVDQSAMLRLFGLSKGTKLSSLLKDGTWKKMCKDEIETVTVDMIYSNLDVNKPYAVLDGKGKFKGMIQCL